MGSTVSKQGYWTFIGVSGYKSRDRKIPSTESAPPVVLQPGDSGFTQSVNSRNGFRVHHVYVLNEKLGQGTFGNVLRGTRKDGGAGEKCSPVAIKATKPNELDRLGSPRPIVTHNDIEARCQEVRTLAKLRGDDHSTPYVLHLYEYYWTDRNLYLVTEILGSELGDWINKQKSITEGVVRDIAKKLLKAIRYMHRKGVVHRDLKKENIIFGVDGDISTLKIVDFGLARELSPGEKVSDFCGTPGYMAPELYQRYDYSFEIDLFAFGVILFRMLSGGEKPFPATNERVLKRSIVDLKYNVDGSAWGKVSDSAKQLVRKLLIAREERLNVFEALEQDWFSNTSDSSRDETRITSVAPGPRDTHSNALSLSRAPVFTDTVTDRFWVDDSALETALERLIQLEVFKGSIVRDDTSANTSTMLIQEMIPHKAGILPHFISGLQVYTEADCRWLFRQLVDTVDAFHTAGVAHRYLHMNNIIVDGNSKLSIKGVRYAQLIRPGHPLTGHYGRKYSWYAYTAPEIDRDFVHDKRVDLWSLGAILYTMLCGMFPFQGNSNDLVLNKHAGKICFEPVFVSEKAQNLVRGLLRVRPDNRLTIKDVLDHEWMQEDDVILRRNDLSLANMFLKDWETLES